MITEGLSAHDYGPILGQYVRERSEEALYRASLLSRSLLESGLGPEDIIALHVEMLDDVLEKLPAIDKVRAVSDAHQFLLEMMIAYGVHYKQYLEFKLAQTLGEADARLQIEHERAMEAERLGRENTEILAMIAHELRTPLAAATQYIEVAERLFARGMIDQIPAQMGSVRQALQRLSRLSGDLVEASRGEAPRLKFSTEDIEELIDQVFGWVTPTAGSQGLTLRHERSPEPLIATVSADAVLTIVGNLLSNAVRYTPNGGEVILRTAIEGTNVVIAVTDTGIGVAEDQAERIFEKFYRSPQARDLQPQGLGLGLALVKQLVEAHGGQISLKSAPGRGSTFRVVLPLTQPQGSAQE